jgi:hypothetical protein
MRIISSPTFVRGRAVLWIAAVIVGVALLAWLLPPPSSYSMQPPQSLPGLGL